MAINNEPTIRQVFPHAVTVHETMWIPLDDGTQLAARIWLPENAVSQPVPAILEYVPYRRRDGTRLRDDPMHSWFSVFIEGVIFVFDDTATTEIYPLSRHDALPI